VLLSKCEFLGRWGFQFKSNINPGVCKANKNWREWRVGHSDMLADKKKEICWTVSVAGVAE